MSTRAARQRTEAGVASGIDAGQDAARSEGFPHRETAGLGRAAAADTNMAAATGVFFCLPLV